MEESAPGQLSLEAYRYSCWPALSIWEGHGGMHISQAGRTFLKEKHMIQLRFYPKMAVRKKETAATRGISSDLPVDNQLLNALKAMRQRLAKEQNVPAYVILHDKTLKDIAQQKPTSKEALLTMHGIGQAKLDRYGDKVLEVLEAHHEENSYA